MIAQDGIIDVAEFCPSPNFDERPDNTDIDLFVIHAISLPAGNYNTQLIKDLFLNRLDPGRDEFLRSIQDLKVSSHFLITAIMLVNIIIKTPIQIKLTKGLI